MSKDEIKLSIRALKELGIYIEFIKNYTWEYRYSSPATIKKYLEDVPLNYVIREAFLWSSTKEGVLFWAEVSKLWEYGKMGKKDKRFLERLKIGKEKIMSMIYT